MGKLQPISRDEIFGNWKMLSREGALMCRLSTKKAMWYVERGLADVNVTERTIQLKFEPNGMGDDNPYLLEDRVAICVVCGTEHNLTNHHVVPTLYRKHLPDSYKAHNSHDNLLICDHDHDRYERIAWDRKKRIQQIYAPIPSENKEQRIKLIKATRAAYALAHLNHKIPDERKRELIELVAPFNVEMTVEALTEFSQKYTRHIPTEVDGESVVTAVVAKGDETIRRFIEGWRQHFVDTTQPQFMSKNWSIHWHR